MRVKVCERESFRAFASLPFVFKSNYDKLQATFGVAREDKFRRLRGKRSVLSLSVAFWRSFLDFSL